MVVNLPGSGIGWESSPAVGAACVGTVCPWRALRTLPIAVGTVDSLAVPENRAEERPPLPASCQWPQAPCCNDCPLNCEWKSALLQALQRVADPTTTQAERRWRCQASLVPLTTLWAKQGAAALWQKHFGMESSLPGPQEHLKLQGQTDHRPQDGTASQF